MGTGIYASPLYFKEEFSMKYQGNAKEIAESIVDQFKSGNIIAPLSQVFFQNPDLPSANYSVGNKLLIK